MHFYNTETNTNSTNAPEEGLDERWDASLGYYCPSNPNEQQKKSLDVLLQQNIDVSPPLSVKSNGSINTAYFREDLDGQDYCNMTVVPTPSSTPPCAVDYLTSYKDNGYEDLSIVALDDVSPNECIVISNRQETQDTHTEMPTPPACLSDYHLDLVRYYAHGLLQKTDTHTISPHVIQLIESTLPPMYQDYILSVRKLFSSL